MKINPENIDKTKKRIKELMVELKKESCNKELINEMKEILETIGQDSDLYKKYSDIYDDAADSLMFAGVEAEECVCDPLRKHVPKSKEANIPE
ncbi:MAG: hypothetical protein GF329_19505 [Candidatus Lokiarchaeota archaeon]|nr:hypothetical protein [Candidatus Lokiarchaeota archaeon]